MMVVAGLLITFATEGVQYFLTYRDGIGLDEGHAMA